MCASVAALGCGSSHISHSSLSAWPAHIHLFASSRSQRHQILQVQHLVVVPAASAVLPKGLAFGCLLDLLI
jgi:hypothetical protein